ncbi:MAG: CBS domain-containing protein [Candidatus Altiarchaeota archaeon]
MKITEIMSRDIEKIDGQISVRQAAEHMAARDIGGILVESAGVIMGVITERDLLKKVVAKGLDPEKTKAEEIMTLPLITVTADYTVDDVIYLMSTLKIRRVVVEEEGKAVGVVSARDIIQSKLSEMPKYSELEKAQV